MPSTRKRVDGFWERVFGEASFGGCPVVEHGELLAGYPGIYCVVRHGTVLVSAPPSLVGAVTDWRPSIETAMVPRWWSHRRPGWVALGPSVHSFLDRSDLLPPEAGDINVQAMHLRDLHQLREKVTHAEWSESGFAGDDVEHAWGALNQHGRPLAASSLTPFDGVPADVGVLAGGTARGRGLATAVAAAAVRHAVEHHGIARWRALATNSASRLIAQKLGFEDDCLQLVLRPQ